MPAMPNATLIVFSLKSKGKTRGETSRFYRELYGYENYSHYGRYRSRIRGYLDGVRNIRYSKGIILIPKEEERQVVTYLKAKGARVMVWEVIPREREWKQLRIPAR